jgi:hypothetical protein
MDDYAFNQCRGSNSTYNNSAYNDRHWHREDQHKYDYKSHYYYDYKIHYYIDYHGGYCYRCGGCRIWTVWWDWVDGRNCLCSWVDMYLFECILLAVLGMRNRPKI